VKINELDLPEEARVVYYYRDDKCYFAEQDGKLHEGEEIVMLTDCEHRADLNERCNPQRIEDQD
jgi:hypothetical protein